MKKFKKVVSVLISSVMLFGALPFASACGDDSGKGDGKIDYSVTIKRSSGDGINDALGLVYKEDDTQLTADYTDENGTLSFRAPKGTYRVEFGGKFPEGYPATGDYVVSAEQPKATYTLKASLLKTPMPSKCEYEVGDVMHDFSYTDTLLNESSISKLLGTKKAVMLNFWFVNCSWCETEFPGIQNLYEQFSDEIEILGINAQDDLKKVEEFRKDTKDVHAWDELTFPMISKENAIAAELVAAFKISGYPTSVIIDREGVICFKADGACSEDVFLDLFETYTAVPYTQKIYFPGKLNLDEPDVEAPTSAQIENAINDTASGFTFSYYFDEDKYNWPWVVLPDGSGIKASNTGHASSYAIMYTKVAAEPGQVIAFDYKVSSEEENDNFYVFLDGVLMRTYSGKDDDYKTCYAYVPDKTGGKYELSLAYVKDAMGNGGEDTVYVKNMRLMSVDDLTERTEMLYRAVTGEIKNDRYENYATVVYNETDKFYHVGTADGPLLLADLMNPTSWSNTAAWEYISAVNEFKCDLDGDGTQEDYLDSFTAHAQWANNSRKNGFLPVTEELKTELRALTKLKGKGHADEWLELCSYFRIYGGKTGEQLEDPTKGVHSSAAYDITLSTDAANPVYNHFNKEMILMPAGMWYKFTPEERAVYSIRSVGEIDSYCWIYDEDLKKIAENDDDYRRADSQDEMGNFAITMVMEAGKTYYIVPDFNNVETMGEFEFIVEKLAKSGSLWESASSGAYKMILDDEQNIVGVELEDAVEYVLGADNNYHVKNEDGSAGELLYINLTQSSNLFPQNSIEQMLDLNCYYCKHCGLKYPASVKDFEETANPFCPACSVEGAKAFAKLKMFELPTARRHSETGEVLTAFIEHDNGEGYVVPMYELDTMADLSEQTYFDQGSTPGDLFKYGLYLEDYTEIMRGYVAEAKKTENNPTRADEVYGTVHSGYVPASKELVDILTKFVVFGDYAFASAYDDAWLILASYYKILA